MCLQKEETSLSRHWCSSSRPNDATDSLLYAQRSGRGSQTFTAKDNTIDTNTRTPPVSSSVFNKDTKWNPTLAIKPINSLLYHTMNHDTLLAGHLTPSAVELELLGILPAVMRELQKFQRRLWQIRDAKAAYEDDQVPFDARQLSRVHEFIDIRILSLFPVEGVFQGEPCPDNFEEYGGIARDIDRHLDFIRAFNVGFVEKGVTRVAPRLQKGSDGFASYGSTKRTPTNRSTL